MAEMTTKAVDIKKIVAAIWRRKFMICALVGAFTVFSYLVVDRVTPKFTAETTLILRSQTSQIIQNEGFLAIPRFEAAYIVSEVDLIRSPQLVRGVMDALRLFGEEEFNGMLVDEPTLSEQVEELVAKAIATVGPLIGFEAGPAAAGTEPGGEEDRQFAALPTNGPILNDRSTSNDWPQPVVNDTMRVFYDGLDVLNDGASFTVKIRYTSVDPERAAAIANGMARAYIDAKLGAKLEEINRITDWTSAQIAERRDEVSRANAEVQKYREQANLAPLTAGEESLLAEQLLALNNELVAIRGQLEDADARVDQMNAVLANRRSPAGLDFVSDNIELQDRRTLESQIGNELADLQSRLGAGHPDVIRLQAQLNTVRSELNGRYQEILLALQTSRDRLVKRELALQAEIEERSRQAASSNAALLELRRLEDEANTRATLLESFLVNYNEVVSRLDVEDPGASIISEAFPPNKPSYPKKLAFVAVSFIGSGGLSLFLVFFLEWSRKGYASADELNKDTGLEVMGVVPVVEVRRLRKRPQDAVIDRPNGQFSEAVKSAQFAIDLLRGEDDVAKILVTSSLPGEGKSAFSAALARSLASSGRQVLLLDCDIRRGTISEMLGGVRVKGLTELVRGKIGLENILHLDRLSDAEFIGAGAPVDDPQNVVRRIMGHPDINSLMQGYDAVVIDTPPTLAAPDAAILAEAATTVIYIVQFDETPREAVRTGLKSLEQFKVHVDGLVINKFRATSKSYGYVAYGNY